MITSKETIKKALTRLFLSFVFVSGAVSATVVDGTFNSIFLRSAPTTFSELSLENFAFFNTRSVALSGQSIGQLMGEKNSCSYRCAQTSDFEFGNVLITSAFSNTESVLESMTFTSMCPWVCSFSAQGFADLAISRLAFMTRDHIALDRIFHANALTSGVPEPAGLVLLAIGILGLGLSRKYRGRQKRK